MNFEKNKLYLENAGMWGGELKGKKNLPLHRSLEQLYNPLITARRLRLMELSTARPKM